MSTRGYMGLKKKGELKGQYNHWDSYFSGLGKEIIETLNTIPKSELIDRLNKTYDNITLVDENTEPTLDMVDYALKHGLYDNKVSTQSVKDVYCLFRNCQGDLQAYLDGLKYMLNGNDFLKDSLFCEYGYVINLDTNTLDIYMNGENLVCQADLLNLDYDKIEQELKHITGEE